MTKPFDQVITDSDVIHIVPVHDLKNHLDGIHCWCNPEVEKEGKDTIITHWAADGREFWGGQNEGH